MAREKIEKHGPKEKNVREKREPRTAPEETEPNSVSEASEPTSGSEQSKHIEVTCPRCKSRWTCADPADSTCPDCDASFSVRVRDEFALVERGGWTVAVSLATSDWQGVVGDG